MSDTVRSYLVPLLFGLLAFSALGSIHIIGFTKHSDHQLLLFMDQTSFTYIVSTFFLYAILATFWARVYYFVGRGVPLMWLIIILSKMNIISKFRIHLRTLIIFMRRYDIFSHCLVGAIALIIFSSVYLDLGVFGAFFIILVVIGIGFSGYFLSEDSLLRAAVDIRDKKLSSYHFNKDSVKRAISFHHADKDEVIRNKVIFRENTKRFKRIILVSSLILSLLSYTLGTARASILRDIDTWQIEVKGSLKVFLPTNDGFIAWNNEENKYMLFKGTEYTGVFLHISEE